MNKRLIKGNQIKISLQSANLENLGQIAVRAYRMYTPCSAVSKGRAVIAMDIGQHAERVKVFNMLKTYVQGRGIVRAHWKHCSDILVDTYIHVARAALPQCSRAKNTAAAYILSIYYQFYIYFFYY